MSRRRPRVTSSTCAANSLSKKQKMFIVEDPSELVLFRVLNSSKLIKIDRSLLTEVSPVIKRLLEVDDFTEAKPIVVDDDVSFDLMKAFLSFVEALHEEDPKSWLTNYNNWDRNYVIGFNNVRHVYYFAKKYEIRFLEAACKEAVEGVVDIYVDDPELAGFELPTCLDMIQELGQESSNAMKRVKTVHLEIKKNLLLEKFELAKKYNVKEFMDQVVTFACLMDFDPNWPQDLKDLIFVELQSVANKEKLKKKLHTRQANELKRKSRSPSTSSEES